MIVQYSRDLLLTDYINRLEFILACSWEEHFVRNFAFSYHLYHHLKAFYLTVLFHASACIATLQLLNLSFNFSVLFSAFPVLNILHLTSIYRKFYHFSHFLIYLDRRLCKFQFSDASSNGNCSGSRNSIRDFSLNLGNQKCQFFNLYSYFYLFQTREFKNHSIWNPQSVTKCGIILWQMIRNYKPVLYRRSSKSITFLEVSYSSRILTLLLLFELQQLVIISHHRSGLYQNIWTHSFPLVDNLYFDFHFFPFVQLIAIALVLVTFSSISFFCVCDVPHYQTTFNNFYLNLSPFILTADMLYLFSCLRRLLSSTYRKFCIRSSFKI